MTRTRNKLVVALFLYALSEFAADTLSNQIVAFTVVYIYYLYVCKYFLNLQDAT